MRFRNKDGKMIELRSSELCRSDVYIKLWKIKYGKEFPKNNYNISKVKAFVNIGIKNVR